MNNIRQKNDNNTIKKYRKINFFRKQRNTHIYKQKTIKQIKNNHGKYSNIETIRQKRQQRNNKHILYIYIYMNETQ